MQKGQYIRLFLSSSANPTKVIAAAKEMQLHLSAATDDSSTKDTTADWLEYEVTSQSYEITGSALILTPDDTLGGSSAVTLNDMLTYIGDDELYWKISVVEGTNNRTEDEVICSGKCKLTSLQMSGQNAQNATYSYTLAGYDGISVPGGSSGSEV